MNSEYLQFAYKENICFKNANTASAIMDPEMKNG